MASHWLLALLAAHAGRVVLEVAGGVQLGFPGAFEGIVAGGRADAVDVAVVEGFEAGVEPCVFLVPEHELEGPREVVEVLAGVEQAQIWVASGNLAVAMLRMRAAGRSRRSPGPRHACRPGRTATALRLEGDAAPHRGDRARLLRGGRARLLDRGHARLDNFEAVEEAGDLGAAAVGARLGEQPVETVAHLGHRAHVHVIGDVRDRQRASRRYGGHQLPDDLPRVVLVADQVEHGDQHHGDRPGEVDRPARDLEDLAGVAQVRVDVVGRAARSAAEQGAGMRQDHRIRWWPPTDGRCSLPATMWPWCSATSAGQPPSSGTRTWPGYLTYPSRSPCCAQARCTSSPTRPNRLKLSVIVAESRDQPASPDAGSTGQLVVDAAFGGGQRLAGAAPAELDQLRGNRYRRFLGRPGPEVQPAPRAQPSPR